MTPDLRRKMLIASFHSYLAQLDERGMDFLHFSDDELSKMELHDLSELVKQARDLSRTPPTR